MKSVRWALLATVVGLSVGGAKTSEAAIFDYSYKFNSTGSILRATFDGTFRPDNNIFDITGVSSVTLNGNLVNDSFFISGFTNPTPFASLDGTTHNFFANSNTGVFLSEVSGNVGRTGANSSLGGIDADEVYDPANFNARAAGPGAPAPEVGMGLLSAFAAVAALALARFRRSPKLRPA